MKKLFVLLPLLALVAFTIDTRKTKIYPIGGSTIANKEKKVYLILFHGMPFSYFFDSTV